MQTSRCALMTSANVDKLEKNKNEAIAVRQTTWALKLLSDSVKLKYINLKIQAVKETELNAVLKQFFGSIQTT